MRQRRIGPFRSTLLALCTVAAAVTTVSFSAVSAAATCAGGPGARALEPVFGRRVGDLVGEDYQRAFPLDDGRVLWVFQDAFVATPSGRPTLVHNAGLVQDGRCFTTLRGGSPAHPAAWLGVDRTTPFKRWFWPLGGSMGDDGAFHLFLVEMAETGPHYLTHTAPVATWTATL